MSEKRLSQGEDIEDELNMFKGLLGPLRLEQSLLFCSFIAI